MLLSLVGEFSHEQVIIQQSDSAYVASSIYSGTASFSLFTRLGTIKGTLARRSVP